MVSQNCGRSLRPTQAIGNHGNSCSLNTATSKSCSRRAPAEDIQVSELEFRIPASMLVLVATRDIIPLPFPAVLSECSGNGHPYADRERRLRWYAEKLWQSIVVFMRGTSKKVPLILGNPQVAQARSTSLSLTDQQHT